MSWLPGKDDRSYSVKVDYKDGTSDTFAPARWISRDYEEIDKGEYVLAVETQLVITMQNGSYRLIPKKFIKDYNYTRIT